MGMIREEMLRRLIHIVEESQIDELEISRWGTRVKITRRQGRESGNGASEESAQMAAAPQKRVAGAQAPEPAAPESDEGLVIIKSPMVGTFYAAPAPGEPTFVNVGDQVAAGQVVCIIEAMKLMNEIHAEGTGRVVKALVANNSPVEYGQPLFAIDPKG